MSMNLSSRDLSAIATKLEDLNRIEDIEIQTFKVASHTVVVELVNSPSGSEYVVKGITNGVLSGPVYRS